MLRQVTTRTASGDQLSVGVADPQRPLPIPDAPKLPFPNLTPDRLDVDLAPDGKRIVALMPVETTEAQKAQNQVVFLMNFFDEVRRRTAIGTK